MAARGEDTLTQIQKYKAMLSSKRNKGDEKAIRKPKKKRLRKGNDDKETSSKSQAESSKEENVDSIKLETNTVLSKESKQSLELPTNDGELVEPKSTITSAGDQELPIDDTPPNEEQEKKEKSKGLSLRRKRKKSKKKRKETEDKVESDENVKEKFPLKESAAELGQVSAATLSPEAKQDESLCDEASPGQKVEAIEESGNDTKPKEGPERKEKISRAQKFKRWANFTKQKKANDSVVIENDQSALETSKCTKSSIQEPESPDNGTRERNVIDEGLPGEQVEDLENNSAKRETVNDHEDLECPPLPEKQRRRSVSLNETTVKENDIISPDNAQRTRSASFGKWNIKPGKMSQEEKVSVGQGNEITSSQNQEEITKLDIENNEGVNEVENEQALEQKANDSIVEDGETGDEKKELQNTESPVKDEQPKKKKKSFLRKISIKNSKANKKDDNGTEKPRKPEISSPLLVKFESLTGSNVLDNSKPIEVSPEKPNKRKKSGLNLKLPKALKRVKSTEYEAIGGEEVKKEIEKDEKFSHNYIESQEKVQESVESNEVVGSEVDKSAGYHKEEEIDGVVEVYSFCRGLMNDVLRELLDHMTTKTEQDETNNMLTPMAEQMKTFKEDEKLNDENKEEEKYCKTNYIDESSVQGESKEMAGEESSELTTSVKEKDQLEKPKEKYDHDVTEKENDEESDINIESKEKSEPQDNANSPYDTEEITVQEPRQPETEPNKPEEGAKQPEEMATPTELEGEPKKLEEKSEAQDTTTPSGDEPNELKEKSEAEDTKTPSGDEPNELKEKSEAEDTTTPSGDEPNELEEKSEAEDTKTPSGDEPNELKEKSEAEDTTTPFGDEPNELEEKSEAEDTTTPSGDEPIKFEEKSEAEDLTIPPEDKVKQPEERATLPESKGEPKESDDTFQRKQSLELSSEKSANELLPSADDKVLMASEGTSNFYANEASVLERSIEVSMKTQALLDSYILIDHSFQLSQEFLKQVESMDLNYLNKRKSRCSIM